MWLDIWTWYIYHYAYNINETFLQDLIDILKIFYQVLDKCFLDTDSGVWTVRKWQCGLCYSITTFCKRLHPYSSECSLFDHCDEYLYEKQWNLLHVTCLTTSDYAKHSLRVIFSIYLLPRNKHKVIFQLYFKWVIFYIIVKI